MTYRILAFDPGGTTGWATYTAQRIWDPELGQFLYSEERWDCGYLDGDHHRDLETLIAHCRANEYIVVYERFIPRPENKGKKEMSLEYERTIINFCQVEEITMAAQMPAMAKGFVKDSHLRTLGLWSSDRVWRHSMDAYRHLLWYLTNKEKRVDILRKAWKQ